MKEKTKIKIKNGANRPDLWGKIGYIDGYSTDGSGRIKALIVIENRVVDMELFDLEVIKHK